ncbi:hypothetical protein DQ244_08835 [Blastococcus sp. TBT05-19]|uniref:hypothetical protein n=1 Tax=Blastococcus sp. TBT05-19 TaxID=2250581 RepID=UPI000DE8F625|nr:hypothetical protein [Blastococcus sp. TBT05-19]RBY92357.1 hypothetical protein DQ244_08835 [Blastococcus sp. TBT05-19]
MFSWLRRREQDEPEIPGMVTSRRRRRDEQPAGPHPALRSTLHHAVLNDTWLFDITEGGFVDAPGTWGPLDPQDCSAQLLRWFDAGLVELHQDDDPSGEALTDPAVDLDYEAADLPLIPFGEARALLADPGRWTDETPDGFAVPVPTERGRDTPVDRWP